MAKIGRPKGADAPYDRSAELKRSALDVISRTGFANATIKKIGEEAGITTAMIYYYFEDKDDLLKSAVEFAIDEAFRYFNILAENIIDPVELIHDWLQMHIELHADISKMMKLMLDYNMSEEKSEQVDRAMHRFYERERIVLIDCLQRGMESGLFKQVDAEETTLLISTFLDGAVVRSRIVEDFDPRSAISAFEKLLWSKLGVDQRGREQGRSRIS